MLILIKIQAMVEEGENFKVVVLDTVGGFERDICNGVYPNKVTGVFQRNDQNIYHYHQLDSLPEQVQLFVTWVLLHQCEEQMRI